MGETLSLFRSSFNKSLRIESRPERLTGEPGAVVLREIMDRTRFIEWMVDRFHDPRKGGRVIYPLADLLRTSLLLLGQGWRDQDDADALRYDAGLRLAACPGPGLIGFTSAGRRSWLSCHGFRNNEVRLQLHVLAYNMSNFLRTPALPDEIEQWSLTTLRERLIKIGAKVVRHGRYITFQLAEVAIPRSLFAKILRLIDDLRPAPLPP